MTIELEAERSRIASPGWLLVAAVLAVNLLLVARYSPDLLANDAAQYVSEARQILAGRGLATDIAYYDEHHRLGRFPVPQTVFPPGYPLAIAAVAAMGVPVLPSAFVVALLSFNLCVALAWAAARRASGSPALAALAGLVLAASVVGAIQVLVCNSEPLFVAATLAGLVGLQRLPDGRRWPLLAGLAAAAAVSVRYAGVFFLAALAVVMTARLFRQRTRRSLVELVLALAPGALTVLALAARNVLLVGDPKGGNAFEISRSIAEVARLFVWGVRGLVGFSWPGLASGRPHELLLVVAVVGLVALAVMARPRWIGGLRERLLQDAGVAVALAYVSISLVALWQLERTRYLGVSSRMLLPLVPFVLIAAAAAARAVGWRKPRLRTDSLAALLGVVYLAGQASLLPLEDSARWRAKRDLRQALQDSETAVKRLEQDAELRRPFLTNEPQFLGGLRDQPVVGLTLSHYTRTRWTCDATERLARSYGVRHVVFFRQVFLDLQSRAPVEAANQECFGALARGEVPSWLAVVEANADPQLFELRD